MSEAWNSDIALAPKGGFTDETRTMADGKVVTVKTYHAPKLILATKCGKVTASRWLHKEDRWEMLAAGEAPVAWMTWPKHPAAPAPQEQEG